MFTKLCKNRVQADNVSAKHRNKVVTPGFLSVYETLAKDLGLSFGCVLGTDTCVAQLTDWRDGSPQYGVAVFSLYIPSSVPVVTQQMRILRAAEDYLKGCDQ